MSRRYSGASENTTKGRTRKPRSQSASEIARNVNSFELWTSYQGCEDASYHDIPNDLQADVQSVFEVSAQLPTEWLDPSSTASQHLSTVLPPAFKSFMQRAHKAAPQMFTSKVSADDSKQLLCEIQSVFSAWSRLKKMRASSRKWSEADYTANVYNAFRGAAVHESDYRAQCSITLPQPLSRFAISPTAVRTLNAKTASPDSAIFVPARHLRTLSHSARSPYQVLKAQGHMSVAGSVGGESSFRYQSTPCTRLPDTPGFELASTFWEDKKHQYIEDAHRQNRMATTSAARQLHALRIRAPIFGLIWAQGSVRAHVDWWEVNPRNGDLAIHSAAYAGPRPSSRRTSGVFHEWDLEQPADILQVYLLVRNLDHWTVTGFLNRAVQGIEQFVIAVVQDGHKIVPWKRKGDLSRAPATNVHETKQAARPSFSITPSSSPPKRRSRRRVPRSS